jgi:hypothetical protein
LIYSQKNKAYELTRKMRQRMQAIKENVPAKSELSERKEQRALGR